MLESQDPPVRVGLRLLDAPGRDAGGDFANLASIGTESRLQRSGAGGGFFFNASRRLGPSINKRSRSPYSSRRRGYGGDASAFQRHTLLAHRAGEFYFSDSSRSEERRVGKECRSRWSPDH